MSEELERASGGMIPAQFTPEQVQLIKNTVARGATDDELALFMQVCSRTKLDPFTKQIHAVKRRVKNPDTDQYEDVMVHQIGIDGFRLQAQRTGQYLGQTPEQWTGPGEEPVWVDCWMDDENPPFAARVGVYKEGFAEPFYGVAKYKEYAQRTHAGDPVKMWREMPSAQLAKCAEVRAIRKAFPNELSGLYADVEMGQADTPETAPGVQTPQALPVEAAKPETEKKDKPKPASDGEALEFTGQLLAIKVGSQGTNAQGAWTLWVISDSDDGEFVTFDDDLADLCSTHIASKAAVKCVYVIETKRNRKSRMLQSVEEVKPA